MQTIKFSVHATRHARKVIKQQRCRYYGIAAMVAVVLRTNTPLGLHMYSWLQSSAITSITSAVKRELVVIHSWSPADHNDDHHRVPAARLCHNCLITCQHEHGQIVLTEADQGPGTFVAACRVHDV
jgi:hypothetical protein